MCCLNNNFINDLTIILNKNFKMVMHNICHDIGSINDVVFEFGEGNSIIFLALVWGIQWVSFTPLSLVCYS